jgi:hypothetical protein
LDAFHHRRQSVGGSGPVGSAELDAHNVPLREGLRSMPPVAFISTGMIASSAHLSPSLPNELMLVRWTAPQNDLKYRNALFF